MLIVLVVIGLLLGSLLNIVIIRLPRESRLIGWPRCTKTGEELRWWQLLPVLGWLLQKGRASNGERLSWVYPLVEVMMAILVPLFYSYYGFSATFFYMVFVCSILIITGAIDWFHRFIYTFVILGAALIALLAVLVTGHITLLNSALGAIAAGFVFMIFFVVARIVFPSVSVPFGLGDVYLAIFIGAAVGLLKLGPTLFLGMMLAGVAAAIILIAKAAGRKDTPTYISYGTYLCLGAILYLALNRV